MEDGGRERDRSRATGRKRNRGRLRQERRCNAERMWERCGQSQYLIVWSNHKSDNSTVSKVADLSTGVCQKSSKSSQLMLF